jgi:hypothetical protein
MAYRLAWWCGGLCFVCFIVGVPLLGHGAATMPYSLTRQEIAEAGTDQGAYLQKKQENSAAWKEIRVGAGFSFTAIGVGFLMWCYCAGWFGRIHRRFDPEASPRVAPALPEEQLNAV